MRSPGLNLARRPFANARPVVRLALLMWLLGAAFFGGNLWLYWDFLSGRGAASARLAQVEAGIVAAQKRIEERSAALADFDLAVQNEEVRYLNARIDERLFSWSGLFDRLARLVPGDAKLSRLSPAREEQRQSRKKSSSGTFLLQIEGEARADEAVLEFVDRLYDDPAFDRPNLASENEDNQGLLSFRLTVPYDPSAGEVEGPAPSPPPVAPTAPIGAIEPPSRPASSSLELEK